MSVGERISARRTELRMTQLELAEKTGLTKQGISKIEGGGDASLATLRKLAKVLDDPNLLPKPEADEMRRQRATR
jgi:transcriptional regulator with XRE-family HTH domain